MDTKKKRTPNQKKKAIVSVLLMVAILITGAFAFLSATDSKTNVFTVGNVKIKLSEEFDTNQNGSIEKTNDENDEVYNASETQVSLKGEILPGQKVIKRPYVENTGKNKAWVYITVGIPTTNSDNTFRNKDTGETSITGQNVDIPIQAYAIQENYANKTTYKDVWNAYFADKVTDTFGAEVTDAKTLSERVPLFEILNKTRFNEPISDNISVDDNIPNDDWEKIGITVDGQEKSYYKAANYDYYVFAYKTLLDPTADGAEQLNRTSDVFEGVRLLKDIGEAQPVKLNYYIKEKTSDTLNGNIDLSVKASGYDGCRLVKTEYYMPGSKVTTLYFDDTLAKTGYSFDWEFMNTQVETASISTQASDENTNKYAYSGMIINKDTDLIANYTDRVDPSGGSSDNNTYLGNDWLVYTINYDKTSSSLYAELNGADYGHINYPKDSVDEKIIIPANITLTRLNENDFTIADGTFKQATEEAKEHINLNEKYVIPVKQIVGNPTLTEAKALSIVTKNLIIGDNIQYIGPLFSNSKVLETVSLPYAASKTESSFKDCTNIKEIVFPNQFQSVGNNMFGGCTSLSQVSFSDSILSIGNCAFANCPITNLKLPANCEIIGQQAFSNCKQLVNIVLPDTVQSIGYRAFEYCSAVKDFTMGKNLKAIGFRALYGWGKIVARFNGTLSEYCSIVYTDVNQGVSVKDSCPSYYASDLFVNGKRVENNLDIPEGVSSISVYAFYNCNDVTSISLPKTVRKIGEGAFEFARNNKLKTISINSDYEKEKHNYSGQNQAFKNVYINQVNIGADVQNIKSLEDINVKNSYNVDSLNHAFSDDNDILYNYNKTQLMKIPIEKSGEIIIPDSVATAYYGDSDWNGSPFTGRNKITKISFGKGFQAIAQPYYFDGCTALQCVELGENVSSINTCAFTSNAVDLKYRLLNLTKLIVDENNPYFYSQDNVIYSKENKLVAYPCGKLDFTMPNSVESIPENFFAFANIQNVTLSNKINTIPKSAFKYSSLKSITIPSAISSMGEDAFKNCSLNSVYYTGTLTEWSNITFENSAANPNVNNKSFYVQDKLVTELDLTGCTKISDNAFIGLRNLTKILIPGSVKSIGYGAFRQCNNVVSVDVQDGVESIDAYAFQSCAKLETVNIAGTVQTIGDYAFDGCSKLQTVTIENGVKELGSNMFFNCASLKTVKMADSITTIGEDCFYDCPNLTNVNIPQSLTTIPKRCFINCKKLADITIPMGVTTIKSAAFRNTGIKSLTIPDSVISMDGSNFVGGVFEGCAQLQNISIGKGLTQLPSSAFAGCTALTSVVIPANISNITGSFSGCTALQQVQLSEGLETLGYGAFSRCTSLEEIILPKSCTGFETRVFDGCTGLKKVTMNGGPKYGLADGFDSENPKVFSNCPNIQEVVFGDNVATVYDWFKDKLKLSKVTIGNASVVDKNAFSGCTNLSDVTVSESLKEIHENAFKGCEQLSTINLPNSIELIGISSFNKTGLTSVVLPNNDKLIVKQQAFGDAELNQITIPNTNSTIENYAFSNNLNLQTIDFKGTKSEWNTIQGDRTFIMLGLHSGCTILCTDGNINFS